jgi:hypothetical protein
VARLEQRGRGDACACRRIGEVPANRQCSEGDLLPSTTHSAATGSWARKQRLPPSRRRLVADGRRKSSTGRLKIMVIGSACGRLAHLADQRATPT